MEVANPSGRILVLAPGSSGGGAEALAPLWSSALTQAGYQVETVFTHEASSAVGLSIGTKGGSHLGRVRALRSLLIREKPDVIVSLLTYTNILMLLVALTIDRSRRPRTVISEHNLLTPLSRRRSALFRAQVLLAKRLYRTADILIAVSSAVAGEAGALFGLPPNKVVIVPNVVQPDSGGEAQRSSEPVLDEDPRISLIFSGRFVPQKSPDLFVEVATHLSRRGLLSQVELFGTGPLLAEVTDSLAELRIDYRSHGWVDAWWDVEVGHSAVLALTSEFEGFGNVLIEAGRRGIPVVACRQAMGVSDAIAHGITGFLVNGRTPEEFAEGVIAASRLSINRESRFFEQFTVDAVRRSFESILRSMEVDSSRRAGSSSHQFFANPS
ncbi:glycosyltransferase [Gordonia sp. 135]|uniref:glycosyltransferase family 4 protein n=1 Tax=Gordonia sp. 135 TaxID=2676309 RepID=UPI0012BB1DEB|nr:glycosyltransferase family 4 protein [Gordonia sp. 135]QGP87137.1 glycosyltransferase [Gordonia sp. 135]